MKPKIGNIIEIPVEGGFAYALFTHKVKPDGDLIRVWSEVHEQRPMTFEHLAGSQPSFSSFVALTHSVSNNFVSIVGRMEVPPSLAAFPVFRSGLMGLDRLVSTWWLWDGTSEWKVGGLRDEIKHLPIRTTWTFAMLKLKIETKWDPVGAHF